MHKLSSIIFLLFFVFSQTANGAEDSNIRILILGDSLSAAHNIRVEESWPKLLHDNMVANFPKSKVINASISGETTFGGRQRLEKLLNQHHPSHLVIELGGNDGLRGLNFEKTTSNLEQMITMAKKKNIDILLIGVRMPPNLGPVYNARFQSIFESLVEKHGIHYLPKFLDGIAASESDLMQSDGIHPTEKAQPVLALKVFQAIKNLLES